MNIKNLRPIAYVLANSNHGCMIVNRYDYHSTEQGSYGVGYQLLNTSSFDQSEIDLALNLLNARKNYFGEDVVAIDCGANIGVHTIEWAKYMHKWGSVISIEAQQKIFYALAGNIAINNCFNVNAMWAAVGSELGEIYVPSPNYLMPSSFGSLELIKSNKTEYIGQSIDYTKEKSLRTQMITIDSLNLSRLDFIKLDIEGMEINALNGGLNTINKFKPQLLIEKIKSDENKIREYLINMDYKIFSIGINILAVHQSDPTLKNINTI